MQDDITLAIKNLRDALEEISISAGKAEEKILTGRGTARDRDILEYVEDMEGDGEKILEALKDLETRAGLYDNWQEAK